MTRILKPTWGTAVAITVLFFTIQYAASHLLGVNFETMTDTTGDVWHGLVLRVGITATFMTLLALWLRRHWNGGIYRQAAARLPRWMWTIPALMIVLTAIRIAANDWSVRGTEYMVALAVGCLFVGVAEETTFRGLNVRALRGSTSNEATVMVISALLFGLVHLVNILNGANFAGTLGQVANAFMGGLGFYIALRLTGSLLFPILLHAFWDFPVLGRDDSIANAAEAASLAVLVVVYALTFIAVISVYRTNKTVKAA